MARTVFVLLILIFLAMSWVIIRFSKDFYLLLPMQMPSEEVTEYNYQDWKEYNDSEGQFKVLFPKAPQRLTERTLDPKTKVYRKHDTILAEGNKGEVFMINKITYPMTISKLTNVEDPLTAIMNDLLAANKENQIKSVVKGDYKGMPSLTFTIENNELSYDVKAFATDKTIYVLTFIGKKGLDNHKDFEFFVNSFDLSQKKE